MRALLFITLLALPLASFAEGYSNAPMLVVGNGAPIVQEKPAAAPAAEADAPAEKADTNAMLARFPAQAVTTVDKSKGVAKPSTPGPAAPNAVSKKWPKDTAEIFTRSCAGFHPELVQPCQCVITNLMDQMEHDEFLRLSAAANVENDPRYLSIRQACATKPQQRPAAAQ